MIKDKMHHPFDLQVKLNGKESLLQAEHPLQVQRGSQGVTASPSWW